MLLLPFAANKDWDPPDISCLRPEHTDKREHAALSDRPDSKLPLSLPNWSHQGLCHMKKAKL